MWTRRGLHRSSTRSSGTPRTPQAMRASVTDRLRALVKAEHRLQLNDLLRQFAYGRALARVSAEDAERWLLKGATALLARLGPNTRHTKDIDLYNDAGDPQE